MHKFSWRFLVVAAAVLALAGCGNRETREALKKASDLEQQKQYQDANSVLVEALRARETKLRPETAPTDPAEIKDLDQKVSSDGEILKMERAQVALYLRMEKADLASAVYIDILKGSPGDTVLEDPLKDPDPVVRTGAVRVLGLAGSPAVVPALVAAIKDDDKDVRRVAVAALGTIKDPSVIDPLIGALRDSYWFVRSEAAGALGELKDARAIKPLLAAVGDIDANVQQSAETAVLTLCTTSGVSADEFASRLNDPNPKIVVVSAVALAVLKDPRAVPELTKLAASPDPITRLQAIKGLGESGDPSVIPILRETLKDPDVNQRGWSIIGLGNLKDEGSLGPLSAIAADTSQPSTIRNAALGAIRHMTETPVLTPKPLSATPPAN